MSALVMETNFDFRHEEQLLRPPPPGRGRQSGLDLGALGPEDHMDGPGDDFMPSDLCNSLRNFGQDRSFYVSFMDLHSFPMCNPGGLFS